MHINKTGTSAWWRIIKETVPINSSLQLRIQYSQDEAERKHMLEKYSGFHLVSSGLSDFTTSSSQSLEKRALRAIRVSSE